MNIYICIKDAAIKCKYFIIELAKSLNETSDNAQWQKYTRKGKDLQSEVSTRNHGVQWSYTSVHFLIGQYFMV
jgi:Tfp pilus assembly protein PilX